MSCIYRQPVRPEFKDSYKDLLDKPKINGVTLSGNLTAADLGIKAGAQFKIVQELPVTGIDEATIYLVPVEVGQTDNIYQEWIYINNKWEKIGEPITIDTGTASFVLCTKDIVFKHSGSVDNLSGLQNATDLTFNDNCYYKLLAGPETSACVRLDPYVTITGVNNMISPGADSPGMYIEGSPYSRRFKFTGITILNGSVFFEGSQDEFVG
jgi:hypothetical protein